MNKPYLFSIFESNYCRLVFVLSLFGIFAMMPRGIFHGRYMTIGFLFLATASLTFTCIIKNIHERIKLARGVEQSFAVAILTGIGIISLQFCGMGAPICGATIGMGAVSLILPGISISFFSRYAPVILVFVIILQLFSLYSMNCFKLTKFGRIKK